MKDSTILFIGAFILAVAEGMGWTAKELHPLAVPLIACTGYICSAIEGLKR